MFIFIIAKAMAGVNRSMSKFYVNNIKLVYNIPSFRAGNKPVLA